MSSSPTQPDTPNQSLVRADGSSAWDEGEGGGGPPSPTPKAKAKAEAAEPPAEEATTEDAPDEAT